jgi:hypothetical protein
MQKRSVEIGDAVMRRLARARLSPQQDEVRKYILKTFAKDGKAPDVGEMAEALGLFPREVRRVCGKLAEHDLIVWEAGRDHILSAYPFSVVPTAHHVSIEGSNTVYAMCAIDALGIPFMLGRGAAIASACVACQRPVRVAIHEGLLRQADPMTTVVWFSARDGCCVAEARCPLINFYCEAGHLQRWRAEHSHELGTALTLMDAVEVGKAIFGELLT